MALALCPHGRGFKCANKTHADPKYSNILSEISKQGRIRVIAAQTLNVIFRNQLVCHVFSLKND